MKRSLLTVLIHRFSTSHYETLQVSRNANPDQIRRAFLKQARKYHPDVNKTEQAKEIIKKVNLAYETLKDLDKRRIYDLSLDNPNFSEDPNTSSYDISKDMYASEQQGGAQKNYYQNKWYGFSKPGYDNLRDEYTRRYQQFEEEQRKNEINTQFSLFMKVIAVISLFLGGEYLSRILFKEQWDKKEQQKKLLETQFEESKVFVDKVPLNMYIQHRAQLNRVD